MANKKTAPSFTAKTSNYKNPEHRTAAPLAGKPAANPAKSAGSLHTPPQYRAVADGSNPTKAAMLPTQPKAGVAKK